MGVSAPDEGTPSTRHQHGSIVSETYPWGVPEEHVGHQCLAATFTLQDILHIQNDPALSCKIVAIGCIAVANLRGIGLMPGEPQTKTAQIIFCADSCGDLPLSL